MKKVALSLAVVFIGSIGFSKEDHKPGNMEALVNSLKYEHSGTVILQNGVGKISIPQGFKYLEPSQAEKVLTELWGNPKNDKGTLGLLMPEGYSLLNDNCCVIDVRYDKIGYVKDDDADAINYSDLMAQMQKESVEENEQRRDAGYEPITIQGWAFQPYYDKNRKILHAATVVKIGSRKEKILNYKVRILGREGVLVLHAIAPVSDMTRVQSDMSQLLDKISFSDVYCYQSFNPEQDQVAMSNIGGLVSGNMFKKFDFMTLMSKYWTILLIFFIAFYRPVFDEIRRYIKDEREFSMH